MAEGRTWRSFLFELVIVVLGVLIALALGDLAEDLRWKQAVGLARKSLAAEMAYNNSFFQDRLAAASCLERRIDTVAALIEEVDRTHRIDRVKGVALLPGRRLEDSQWQSERASGVLTHFPRQELTKLGRYYVQLGDFHNWIADESNAWISLGVLENGPKRFSDFDIALLRRDVERARRLEYLVKLNARRQLEVSRELGVIAGPANPSWKDRVCPPFRGEGDTSKVSPN